MVDENKISITIPSYNRSNMTIESFSDVYHDDRVSEIIVVDDCSDNDVFSDLKDLIANEFYSDKVKLYRNQSNRDCYANKATALSYANNDWCILLDSDNRIYEDYINRLYYLQWDKDTIYTPDFAYPSFDFRSYSNLVVTKENVSDYISLPLFETMLNAANYFVNKDEYLKIWDGSIDPVTSDSIYMISKWLEYGNKVHVVSGLQYFHRIHQGHYQTNIHKTPQGLHESILNKLKSMI